MDKNSIDTGDQAPWRKGDALLGEDDVEGHIHRTYPKIAPDPEADGCRMPMPDEDDFHRSGV